MPLLNISAPMSSARLAREFFICVCLSFVIILGVIHAFLHLIHLHLLSEILRSPVADFLAETIVQIAQISQLHEYLFVVFKVTFACSILVFAVREIVMTLFYWIGCSNVDSETVDWEAKLAVADLEGQRWAANEKLPYFVLLIPAPGKRPIVRSRYHSE
ncbi:hypothetical protein MVEN_02329200 [Mycena venus]|uniref:Uncharacterized protein n=1 Tax=Mycena venus TaxID=2733690 RepID=A0A8H6X3L7_9AGAR|nr:hypothetical protein MVEN_02329200 [Mycena venus]